jgi:ribulose-5-phosphate 4-epimerase/fuculose-1-phosphate aldolase
LKRNGCTASNGSLRPSDNFSRYGCDQGLAGHITVRDPEFPDRFWINPLSKFFGQIKVSDLQLVSHEGNILIGDKPINQAGFVIHSAIHAAHPEVIAAAHTRPHVKMRQLRISY